MSDNNKCSDLQIEDVYASYIFKSSSLEDLMNLQYNIQTEVYGYDFAKLRERTGDVVEYFKDMNLAIDDERMEQYEALGGIHSYRNASWKRWKADHKEVSERPLAELTEVEYLELKFELIDELHFLFNKMLIIGMSAREVYNLYYAKNRENIERQKRGY